MSFHSIKLDIFGFRAKTVDTSSRTIFFFILSAYATYHFCSRSLPCRLNRIINCICNSTPTQIILNRTGH